MRRISETARFQTASGQNASLQQQSLQQQSSGVETPAPRLGAMAIQAETMVHFGQSYPQQLVRLVGHRHCGKVTWVRPVADK